MFKRALLATAGILLLALPLAAQAQNVPSYARTAPSYASASEDDRLTGRITSFDGGYDLRLSDDRGFVDVVHLHPGTIINPRGLQLQSGMVATVYGHNSGSYFSANEIDTPYTMYGAIPYYDSQPWYAYTTGAELGFLLGSSAWWHGGYGWHYPHYGHRW